MPNFHLNIGTPEAHKAFDALPEIARGYIEAAFFCANTPEDFNEGAGDPCPNCGATLQASSDPAGFSHCTAPGCGFVSVFFDSSEVGVEALTPEALAGLVGEAMRFERDHAEALAKACEKFGYDMSRAGNDLWYTQNGAGVGFWDRGLGDIGDELSDAARKQGERMLMAGEDFKIRTDYDFGPWEGEPVDAIPPLSDVGGKYGAPMGRRAGAYQGGPVKVYAVAIDESGYDAGGAYWGLGAPLFRAIEDGENVGFVRAATHAEACGDFRAQGFKVEG